MPLVSAFTMICSGSFLKLVSYDLISDMRLVSILTLVTLFISSEFFQKLLQVLFACCYV